MAGKEKLMLSIAPAADRDWSDVWRILAPVIRAGETYPCPTDMTETEARHFWTDPPKETFVARDGDGAAVGAFYLKPDQIGLGDHIANAGYAVAEAARGRGIAVEMGLASQEIAKARGYRAMKFNLVVATNEAAVKAWTKCGMRIIGTIPKAFRHARLGLVDAYIMHKDL